MKCRNHSLAFFTIVAKAGEVAKTVEGVVSVENDLVVK